MDSTLKLTGSQEVVIEGMLLHKSHEEMRGKAGTTQGSTGNWKKRYFVLVRSKSATSSCSALLHFFPKEPKVVKVEEYNNSYGKLRQEPILQEHRLLVGRDSFSSQTSSQSKSKVGGFVKGAKHRVTNMLAKGQKIVSRSGKIDLKAGDQVYLDSENVLQLKTLSKLYQLKMDTTSLSEVSVIAGQWLQALRQCLTMLSTAIRERDMKRNVSITFYSPVIAQEHSETKGLVAMPTNFSDVLKEKVLRDEFLEYLQLMQSSENLYFYEAANNFKKEAELLDSKKPVPKNRDYVVKTNAFKIYSQFVTEDSPQTINLGSLSREEIKSKFARFEQDNVNNREILDANLFENAQSEIYLLMEANFFHNFYKDLSKRTGCFSNLVYRYELCGYDAVFTRHFGSVRTETERIEKRFKNRLYDVNFMITELEEEQQFSSNVAVKSFQSMSEALTNFYGIQSKRLLRLYSLRDTIEKQLNFLQVVSLNVKDQLRKAHEKDRLNIEAFKKNISDKQLLTKFKQKIESSYRDFKQNLIDIEVLQGVFRVEDLTVENVDEVKESLETKLQKRMIELAKEKDALKAVLTLTLDELEKVEVRRLSAQQTICDLILKAEHEYIQGCQSDLEEYQESLRQVNPGIDCRTFAGSVITEKRLGDDV